MTARTFTLVGLVLFLSVRGLSAATIEISKSDAKQLLVTELRHGSFNLPRRLFYPADLPESLSPGFYVFQIVSLNPKSSLVVGNFAVNLRTGSVWSLAGSCRELHSHALLDLQKAFRRRYGIRLGESFRSHDRRPICDADIGSAR
jgi:hypothetical protein